MARRRAPEEHENHERWLVSYADFITLLFAFFVVMYSVSSVNEGKYRVLSDSMTAAFTNPAKSMNPIQIGETLKVPVSQGTAAPTSLVRVDLPTSKPVEADTVPEGDGEEAGIGEFEQGLKEEQATVAEEVNLDPQSPESPIKDVDSIATSVETTFLPMIDNDQIEVRRKGDWIEIEMKSNVIFDSGSARLKGGAVPIFKKLSTILKNFPNPIQVEGYTDNVPIKTIAYPSNWELSAGRAASVVNLLSRYGVRPDRMMAIGYGQYNALNENKTEAERSKNRRVVMIIPAEKTTRQYLDLRRMMQRGNKVFKGRP